MKLHRTARTRDNGWRGTISPRASRPGRLAAVIIAAGVVVAPLCVVSVSISAANPSSGDSEGDIVVGPPAVPVANLDDVFSVAVTAPTPFVIPAVSDGVSTDTFRYAITGTNAAGCSVSANGENFTYQVPGQCTVQITAVSTDDDSDATESAFLVVTVNPAPPLAQTIALASGVVPFPGAVTLTATGYAGPGAVSYALTGGTASGCTISSQHVLTSTSVGTCLVVASIAAGGGYASASSSPASFDFTARAQTIVLASQRVHFPAAVTLTATGYAGPGAVSYALTGGTASGCAISSQHVLTSTGDGTCLVVASIAATSGYASASSSPASIDFVAQNQSITLRSRTAHFRAVVDLDATGYRGAGAITYALTGGSASGCAISAGHRLSARSPGTCLVVASIAADAEYSSAVSDVATVRFLHPRVVVLAQSIDLGSSKVGLAKPWRLRAMGYHGTGRVKYRLVGGTAKRCSLRGGDVVRAASAGTCLVRAMIGAAGVYVRAVSAVATITFVAPRHPPTLLALPIPRNLPAPAVAPTTTMSVTSFAEGSSVLSPALDQQIAAIAARIKALKYRVVDVTGYTDNVFTPAFNQTLNQNRASAVVGQLTADLAAMHVAGVTVRIVINPTTDVFVTGSNVSAQGRAFNRRVVATLKAR